MTKDSKVYMTAVLEYLAAEILEISGTAAKANKKKRILPSHIAKAVKEDDSFLKMMRSTTLNDGGKI